MAPYIEAPLKSNEPNSNTISFVGNDIIVLNSEGICISSSNQNLVGKQFDLSKYSHGGEKAGKKEAEDVAIPIEGSHENVDFFLILDKNTYNKYNVNMIKKFSQMLASKHLESMKVNSSSSDQFFSRLMKEGNAQNFSSFDQEAQTLGIDLTKKRMAITVNIDGYYQKRIESNNGSEKEEMIDKWKRRIQNAFNSFFTSNPDTLCVYNGGDSFTVLKAINEGEEEKFVNLVKKSFNSIFGQLKDNPDQKIIAGLGCSSFGAQGLAKSCHQADLACQIAKKFGYEEGGHCYRDFGIVSILADVDREETQRFAEDILSRIKNETMLETLNVLFQCNLSITDSAKKLKLHRNTIIYRLNQINKILGLDPRKLDEAVTIKTALLIKKLL